MSEILEREEGLFTRHGVTRVLCMVATLGFMAALGMFLLIAYVLLFRPSESLAPDIWRFFVATFFTLAISSAALVLLSMWRKCDRCRRRLFAEAKYESLSQTLRKPGNRVWMNQWWVRGMIEPERHHRAARFLGSYRHAAILGMALKGRLRCQWCNHEDGVKPDYVVTSPQ